MALARNHRLVASDGSKTTYMVVYFSMTLEKHNEQS
jgi:hypothetical protein